MIVIDRLPPVLRVNIYKSLGMEEKRRVKVFEEIALTDQIAAMTRVYGKRLRRHELGQWQERRREDGQNGKIVVVLRRGRSAVDMDEHEKGRHTRHETES